MAPLSRGQTCEKIDPGQEGIRARLEDKWSVVVDPVDQERYHEVLPGQQTVPDIEVADKREVEHQVQDDKGGHQDPQDPPGEVMQGPGVIGPPSGPRVAPLPRGPIGVTDQSDRMSTTSETGAKQGPKESCRAGLEEKINQDHEEMPNPEVEEQSKKPRRHTFASTDVRLKSRRRCGSTMDPVISQQGPQGKLPGRRRISVSSVLS